MRALALVDECLATHPKPMPAWAVAALVRLHQPARALAMVAGPPTSDDAGIGFRLWSPAWAELRQLPQFSDAAARIGWMDAWDKYGPPDKCRRVSPRKYVCE
jgi:hypothetical protein